MPNLNYQVNGIDLDDIYVKHSEWPIIPSQYAKHNYVINGIYEAGHPRGPYDSSLIYIIPSKIAGNDWSKVFPGLNYSYAIKSDGTLWSWGRGGNGQLAQGNTNDYLIPTQIGTDSDWASVAIGAYRILALKTDGTLWACGSDTALWNANYTTFTHIQIGKFYKSVCHNGSSALAIDLNDKLWAWGDGSNGILGTGSNGYVGNSPVQIGTSSWKQVIISSYEAHGIKTDGTIWGWGSNGGSVGDNTTTQRFSPTAAITNNSNYVSLGSGNYSVVAIKADGTMWSCGMGYLGQLGTGNSNDTKLFVQVGSSADWASVSGDYDGWSYIALKTDGTVWGWGANDAYQLGLGDTNYRDVPTQIGTATNWTAAKMGLGHSALIAQY